MVSFWPMSIYQPETRPGVRSVWSLSFDRPIPRAGIALLETDLGLITRHYTDQDAYVVGFRRVHDLERPSEADDWTMLELRRRATRVGKHTVIADGLELVLQTASAQPATDICEQTRQDSSTVLSKLGELVAGKGDELFFQTQLDVLTATTLALCEDLRGYRPRLPHV